MITADHCRRARVEGRAAQLRAANPYAGKSLALAKLWAAGYEDMLLERWYSTPTARRYLRNSDERGGDTVSALDSGTLGTRVVTDLDQLAQSRAFYLETYGYRMPLQDAERAVGLTEADIWEARGP